MSPLPRLALSVRQPWAWAILHGGKTIENRSAASIRHMNFSGVERLAIHAAKGMTRDEYEEAAAFMAELGVPCPPPADLARGGIVGAVAFGGIVTKSGSPWFFGPRGLVLEKPEPCAFIPCRGALGLFEWTAGDPADVPAPAKWMRAPAGQAARIAALEQEAWTLFRSIVERESAVPPVDFAAES